MAQERDIIERGSVLAIGAVIAMTTMIATELDRIPTPSEKTVAAVVGEAVAGEQPAPVVSDRNAEPAVVPVENEMRPAAEVSSVALGTRISPAERKRLAGELDRWVTRHPRQLVEVVADLAEKGPLPVSPAFLLSIAWSETRGKILAVSPAGAVGLAQATPGAYLSEGFNGRVFMTNSYLIGTRAFIMKKPLGDALETELSARRDMLLRKHFNEDPQRIFMTRPYEAGEFLGEALDARFSPTHMAEFLAQHLKTKQKQAIDLGMPPEKLDAWTAALYNGGAVNIRRMQAGLMSGLTETEKYMRQVPDRIARLERSLG